MSKNNPHITEIKGRYFCPHCKIYLESSELEFQEAYERFHQACGKELVFVPDDIPVNREDVKVLVTLLGKIIVHEATIIENQRILFGSKMDVEEKKLRNLERICDDLKRKVEEKL